MYLKGLTIAHNAAAATKWTVPVEPILSFAHVIIAAAVYRFHVDASN